MSCCNPPFPLPLRLRVQLWKFSGADLCEIARNSVLQSGFEHPFKAHFLGESYTRPGPAGNTLLYTNVPNIRLLFRHESLEAERALLRNAGADKM